MQLIEYLETCTDENLPLLIQLDFQMPKMTGASTLQFLSTQWRYLTLPKMVWSTSNRPEYVEECMKWGATFRNIWFPAVKLQRIRLLLKGIGVKPEQFFDKDYLLLKYDDEVVKNLKWSIGSV